MATETFTKAEFEAKALPFHKKTGNQMWTPLGIKGGEEAYAVIIDDDTRIEVRSSVDSSGVCASTGEDSIRAWLTKTDGSPLGSKVSKYTTRVKGWEDRTKNVLRTLWSWRTTAGNCPTCDAPKQVFKVKKDGKNKGRVFANCPNKCGGDFNQFRWITEAKPAKPVKAAPSISKKELDAEAEVNYIESQQR